MTDNPLCTVLFEGQIIGLEERPCRDYPEDIRVRDCVVVTRCQVCQNHGRNAEKSYQTTSIGLPYPNQEEAKTRLGYIAILDRFNHCPDNLPLSD